MIIVRIPKGQDGVEKRFRTIKGPLLVRPIFVRSDQRIESLVFITLLALLMRAVLERVGRSQGLPYSADRLFQGFATLQAVDLLWADGNRQRQVSVMNPFQTQAMGVLGFPTPEAYACLSPLVR